LFRKKDIMRKSLWTTFTGGAVRISIIVVACLFLWTTGARADTVYTYTGLDFEDASGTYTTMDKVTGTFLLSSPLPAGLPPGTDESALLVSWSMSDGVNTFTGTGPTLTAFDVATVADGEVLGDWNVGIINSVGEISTSNFEDGKESEDIGATFSADSNTFNVGLAINVGTWSSASTVPEPGILSMTFSGLLGLALLVGVKRYRRNLLANIA
jgi:hypothetical protein